MAFNLTLIKEHPYTTGAIVLVGGILLFYLVSSGQQTTQSVSSGSNSDYNNALAVDAQLQQVQAAATVQMSAQQAQTQQTALQASVVNNQTNAALAATQTSTYAQLISSLINGTYTLQMNHDDNTAQTTQLANQLIETQNTVGMQDAVLTDQLDQQAAINANNNATSLAGLVDQLNYGQNIATLQTGLSSKAIDAATTLQLNNQNNFTTLANEILPLAGQQKNSALDATNATSIYQTILSGGNPSVAATGTSASASTAASGNALTSSIAGVIAKGVTSTAGSVISGLFS